LRQVLRDDFKRIGLEAGPLSQWLFSALAEADLPVICVEMSERCMANSARSKQHASGKSGIGYCSFAE
jgi:transposase